MQLTENEKWDILSYIKAGKPLPDKYRFLLFADKREVELVWNGKTNEITNVVLPFQVIEQVDEPRSEETLKFQQSLFDTSGRQLKGWTNKLIWGDNKLILSSLKNGPLREEIEAQGGIKLIYIDPPFDVGADFSMDIEIGGDTLTKRPNVLEELAYRDTWGKGADSFIAMIYERLSLMRDLLADDGSVYVHCDWRVDSYIRLILDEIFGKENHLNDLVWHYKRWSTPSREWQKMHDSILIYAKSKGDHIFNKIYGPRTEETEKRWKNKKIVASHEVGGNRIPSQSEADESQGAPLDDVWDISIIAPVAHERLDYPTQKPETLIERIISASSNDGDIVADFFVGSGTTLAVAEKFGRKWIGSDLGKFAIHTTRKRLICVQRALKVAGNGYRAFEILNLGKYQREHYIGVNPNLREEKQRQQFARKEREFVLLVLSAYKAEPADGFKTFHGKKGARLVAVGPVNLPVSRLFVEEVVTECQENGITKADILGFEFEMGLFPHVQEEASAKGVDLGLRYIPPDVFDKRAVERNQVVFHDVAYIELKPHVKNGTIAIELTDFSVSYNQDVISEVEESLKNGGKKLVVEKGQIIKLTKDKDGIMSRERLTTKWTDWIDYWAVDFDFESKKEFIRVRGNDGQIEERWTGDYIFENEWQDFRTKKKRDLELMTPFIEVPTGRRKVAVKVIDIFGNDTMKIINLNI